MWHLRGRCKRCGLPMVMHILVWLQSIVWRFLKKPPGVGKRVVLIKKALEFFDEVGPPLKITPMYRLNSSHSTAGIITRSQLVEAFYQAQDVSPWVLVLKDDSISDTSSSSGANNGLR